jgi:hypothetical protein
VIHTHFWQAVLDLEFWVLYLWHRLSITCVTFPNLCALITVVIGLHFYPVQSGLKYSFFILPTIVEITSMLTHVQLFFGWYGHLANFFFFLHGPVWNKSFLISASQVSRSIVISHQHKAMQIFFIPCEKLFFVL